MAVVTFWTTIVSVLVFPQAFVEGQVPQDAFHDISQCCLAKNVSHGSDCSGGQIFINASWEVINTTNGRYRMTFSFPAGCQPSKVDAWLRVNEDVSLCQADVKIPFDQNHTGQKTLVVKDWHGENCLTTCDKTGTFYFQFIYPGCYQVRLLLQGSFIYTQPVYLEPEYQKTLLIGNPNETLEATPHSSPVVPAILRINMASCTWRELCLIESKLTVSLNYETEGTEQMINIWDVLLWPNRTATCAVKNDTYQDCDPPNKTCDEDFKRLPHCDIDPDETLIMGLHGIPPGEYFYLAEIDSDRDTRCTLSTVWSELLKPNGAGCLWRFNLTITEEGPSTQVENVVEAESTSLYWTYGITGVILLSALTFVGYFAVRRILTVSPPTVSVDAIESGTETVSNRPPVILLLYSRDCEAFMDLMASFRRLLKQTTRLEVYDCQDPDQWSEVSRNPSGWIQRLTSIRGVQAIVVASPCSSLRQRAQLAGATVRFTHPQFTDDLFPYGLQALTERTATDAYRNTFVVRFDGVSDDNDLFQALNSYTRFVLPSHLDKLFCSVKQWIPAEINESLLDSAEVQTLRNDLDKLVAYKQQHASYLDDLLVMQNDIAA